jgi:putative FmdB family regulatory protein
MPTYEFYCAGCKKKVTLAMTLSQREGGRFACPRCKTKKKMEQILGAFSAKTSRKS